MLVIGLAAFAVRFFWGLAVLFLDILRAALIGKSASTTTIVTQNYLHEASGSAVLANTVNGGVHFHFCSREHEQPCCKCGDEKTPRKPPTATD